MAETDPSPVANCVESTKAYVKTRKGTILTVEIIVSFIVMICYASSSSGGISALAVCEIVFAIAIFVIFMKELDKQITFINWTWTDLFRAGIGSLLYIITSLVAVIGGTRDGARLAGGVFGLIAGVLFAYDAYTIFKEIKSTRGHSAASQDDKV